LLIWVASYPRSGNTLTMLTLRDVFGVRTLGAVFQHGFVPGLGGGSGDDPQIEGVGRLGSDECLDTLEAHPATWFVKTHRSDLASSPARGLHVVRDGRDTLVSHAHHMVGRNEVLEKLPYDERLDRLITVGSGVGTWSESVRAWRTREAPVELVRFEELIRDPPGTVAAACARLGVELPRPTGRLETFESLHRKRPEAFRRGVAGGWPEEMSARLESRFWRAHCLQMRALGYAR
jgi:hypothetical protein